MKNIAVMLKMPESTLPGQPDIKTLPKAVFFDWDGTLADSYVFLERAHNHVREKLGMPAMPPGEFQFYFGKPREMLYELLYKERVEEAKILFADYVKDKRHLMKPLAGAEELLQLLDDAGVIMGVVSNKRADLVRAEVTHFGWGRYFEAVVGAGEASEDKPSAAPLLLALKRADPGLAVQDTWYAGDTDSDLSCAQKAGCFSVFFNNMPQGAEWVEQYKPGLVFKGCTDFGRFLLSLSGK